MSHTYHFACVTCAEVIDVGKTVCLSEAGRAIPLQFAGWRDQATGEWLHGASLWLVLERWHIQHRGHEVRLVSEEFLSQVDPEGQLHYIDSAEEVLGLEVDPPPDDELDARRVPGDVRRRLREHLLTPEEGSGQ